MSCVLYKLADGINFLVCNELFAIGKSTFSLVLHGFVEAVNITFRKSISWPTRTKLNVVMENFKQWHGLLSVHGGINGTHILIYKPKTLLPEDYYYHKIGYYFIVVQLLYIVIKNVR
jgi:hypothetical protein